MNITNPLRIGIVLRDILLGNELISGHVDGRVFPYTTDKEVPTPHIVYDGISVEYEDTKDGSYPSQINVSVHVNTTDYMEGIVLSEEVIDVLTEHEGVTPTAADCDYDGGAMIYEHNLTFTIEL